MVLSSPVHDIAPAYDVVVVGSGYGGGIAASRLARAGRRVCVLERGAEFAPGEFPDTGAAAAAAIHIDAPAGRVGNPAGLFDFRLNEDMGVLLGCGLGGTSLINAGVVLAAEDRVFDDECWPEPLREPGALQEGYQRAEDMLRPVRFPVELGPLPKLEALRTGAAAIGAKFSTPPIAVNFADGVNHVGVPQQACISCGDCVSGCNTSAKNTVTVNYLPDARNHGAAIFTHVRVRWVERAADGWLVHYQPIGYGFEKFDAAPLFIRAEIVVLAAGSLGTTEILLRSAAEPHDLPVSAQLGKGFTSNGDVMAFAYDCEDPVNGVGFGADPDGRAPVGPCITGLADLRGQPVLEHGIVIEEGALPGAIRSILPAGLGLAAALNHTAADGSVADRLRELGRVFSSFVTGERAVQHTLTYLVMAHDKADGEMHLIDDRLRIIWPGETGQEASTRVHDRLRAATAALGGTYAANPMASELLGQDLITVHPLGGARMAENARDGVVDHKGRVFSGTEGTDVHEGLYVCDGAVVPRSLGVNPLLTISALAERCCALLAGDHGWQLDYTLGPPRPKPDPPQRPGLGFTERMRGTLTVAGADTAFEFTLAAAVEDLDEFLAEDTHRARLIGTISAPALSAEPLTAADGTLELLVVDPAEPGTRRMTYRVMLLAVDGSRWHLHGVKLVRNDPGFDLWSDTSTLKITVRDGDESGPVRGEGELHIRPADFARQITTVRTTGVSSPDRQLEVIGRFGENFARALADTYTRPPVRRIPAIAPRTLEGVRDAAVTEHAIRTADGLDLTLLRFTRRPGGDAVLVVHGLTTSTDMFVMPEHHNLVSYLLDEGFDVWCFDARISNRYDYNLTPHHYTLDDCALFDFPPAVARIREHIGTGHLHVIAHCLGATAFTMSLFGRAVDGISSVVANSVALTPRVPRWSQVKLAVTPDLMNLLHIPVLSPRWSEGSWLTPGRLIGSAVSLVHRECDVPACHMLSLMWGTGWPALWRHENLDERTHRRAGDLFGATSMNYYRHVLGMVRAGRAVKYRPAEPRHAALPDDYFAYAREIATPVLFSTGADNRVFADSNIVCHRRLAELGCTQHGLAVFRGYGHQDVFMGRNSAADNFGTMVEFLRRHGNDRRS